MNDILSRIRALLECDHSLSRTDITKVASEAADEIERLYAALATARVDTLEEAARVADRLSRSADGKFAGVMERHRKGERNLELAAAAAAGMDHQARGIAAAIRALKEAK